jgi:hypothetical protein
MNDLTSGATAVALFLHLNVAFSQRKSISGLKFFQRDALVIVGIPYSFRYWRRQTEKPDPESNLIVTCVRFFPSWNIRRK